jgi:hypothetical protein
VVSNTQQQKSNLILPAVIAALLIPIIGGGWWYLERESGKPAAQPVLTQEAKVYTRNLKLGGVEMKGSQNFTGAPLIEITGQITNGGDRILDRVELSCVFYDVSGQVVLRERVPIVKATLKPGETRLFRMPFEGIPDAWNRVMPQLVIAQIQFAG